MARLAPSSTIHHGRLLRTALLLVLLPAAAHALEGRIAYLAHTGDYWQAWLIEAESGESRAITASPYDKTRLSWYPDGRHLLVNGLDGRLFRVEISTGAEEEVLAPLKGILDAVLSPDGKTIAFSVSTSGSRDANDIWISNANGAAPRRLTQMRYLQFWPAWSRDGQWIYFLSGDGGQHQDIWRVRRDGSQREQVSVGGLYHFDVAPGPEGAIAYSSNRTGNYEVWTHAGKGPARRITEDPSVDGGPAWSPDDRHLVFQSGRAGALNLWLAALDGNGLRQLTRHDQGARGAAWWRP